MDNDHWKLLTADSIEIDRLLASINFWVEKDVVTGEFDHANTLIVLSPNGVIAKYVYGLGPNKFYLEVGIDEAMKEEYKLSFTEKLILWAFSYDSIKKAFTINWSLLISVIIIGLTGMCIVAYLVDKLFIS